MGLELHKYTLKPEQRSKLKALIGGQLPVAGGRAAVPALVDRSTREEGRLLNRVSFFVSYDLLKLKLSSFSCYIS
jgi:hypothetical protein